MEVQTIRLMRSPPPSDHHKISADAGYSSTTRIASLGMVARNMNVEVCFSAVVKPKKVESPLHAEIKAILFGPQLATEMNLKKFQMENDSLLAIKEILKRIDSFL